MAASEILDRPLTLERVDRVSAEATVRHVDQLDEESLDAFYRALDGDGCLTAPEIGLEPGTVVVFTDYYLIERA